MKLKSAQEAPDVWQKPIGFASESDQELVWLGLGIRLRVKVRVRGKGLWLGLGLGLRAWYACSAI